MPKRVDKTLQYASITLSETKVLMLHFPKTSRVAALGGLLFGHSKPEDSPSSAVQKWAYLPPPASLPGYPPRGVSAAQGRLMPLAFAAHSPFAAGSCVRFPLVW